MPVRMDAKRYIQRLQSLDSQSSSFFTHYQELSRYLSPRRSRFEPGDYTRAGTKMNQAIVNNTGTRAKRVLSSGMMAGITSPARPWFRLRVPDFELNKKKSVKIWLEQVERVLMEAFARSNLYNGLAVVYDDLATYGTAAMFIEEHPTDIMRVHVPPIGSYFLALDDAYKVNSFYRKTTFSVEQLVRRFGLERTSEATQNLFDRKDYDTRIEVLQVIEPNDAVMSGNLDSSGMPWRSVWIETGTGAGKGSAAFNSRSQVILGDSGFNEWPVPAPRWQVVGEDAYGHSPGMEALGDIRALQHMEKRRAQALDKIVTPPMVGPSLLKKTRVSLLSGDVTYADIPAQRQAFAPAYTVDPKIVLLERELQRHESRINSTFFADLFLMLASSGVRQPITAREVEERHEEKMLQLGPVLERLQDELLDPTIDRAFGILQRRGMIPTPPKELEGRDARPEYISILAQAQKMLAIVGVERMTSFVVGLAEADPSAMDKLNTDRVVDEVAELMGVNPDLVHSDEEVSKIREERAAQAAQMQQGAEAAAAAKDGSQAALNLAKASESQSAQDLMAQFGPQVAGVAGTGLPSA